MRSQPARLFRIALALSLAISAGLFFLFSWRWPLVGDASLIHYIAFLIGRGWAPYRDLGDMNMPGSYLIELAAMHLFGFGALAWRLFDFTLLALASAAFATITERRNWLAALFAGSLFILIHGRDGLAEGGQRDLTMAVLLIAATAFLFVAVRRRTLWPAAVFGLFSGLALTIKPTVLPLTAVQLVLALYALRRETLPGRVNIPIPRYLVDATLAWLIAPLAVLVFLLREHALAAFLAGFYGIIPYYASLGHRPITFVLLHSISPLLPLVLLWLAALAFDGTLLRPALHWTEDWSRGWERAALVAGVLFGLINCILQQRALPYYRYPLLVFLLPLIALDLTRAWTRATPPVGPAQRPAAAPSLRAVAARLLAVGALSFAAFFLAPQSAILIHRYRWWETDFISTLQRNLTALGGAQLSHRVQCIDSISGCGNVLYRMRLEPSTGVLSDFLLFGPPPGEPIPPIVLQTRAQFSAAVLAHPPQVIVVTSHLHIDGPDGFLKLDRWPAFASFLAARYTLTTQWSPTRTARWWSREETPASYRIYVLRPQPAAPPPPSAAASRAHAHSPTHISSTPHP